MKELDISNLHSINANSISVFTGIVKIQSIVKKRYNDDYKNAYYS